MADNGVSCIKGSDGRGLGEPMSCGSGEEYSTGGNWDRCFKSCPDAQHRCGNHRRVLCRIRKR
jgi:hypothetical protein